MSSRSPHHVGIVLDGSPAAWARTVAMVRHVRSQVTVLAPTDPPVGLAPDAQCVRLSAWDDRTAPLLTSTAPGLAPATAMQLVEWAGQAAPDLLVVDGLPDAALLGRLVGTPVVPVRGVGRQLGGGFAALQEGVAAWLAPYPAVLEPDDSPVEQRQRTVHVGFLSPFEGHRLARGAARRRLGIDRDARHALILADGAQVPDVATIAAAASSWEFSVLATGSEAAVGGGRVHRVAGGHELFDHLVAADVVVGDACLGVVADAAAVRRPVAVVPRPAVDDGPARLAGALEESAAALVLDAWPVPVAWPALLAELLDQEPRRLSRISDGRATRRAAEWIDAWAHAAPADPVTERRLTAVSTQAASVADLRAPAPVGVAAPVG